MERNDGYAKEFGRRVRQLRAQVGLRQRGLADRAGVANICTISDVERGKQCSLRLDMLRALGLLCSEHGIKLDWLITGEGTILEAAPPLSPAPNKCGAATGAPLRLPGRFELRRRGRWQRLADWWRLRGLRRSGQLDAMLRRIGADLEGQITAAVAEAIRETA